MNVTAATTPLGQLTFSVSGFSFNANAGGTAPASQALTVTSQSAASATAEASEQTCTSSNWLTLSPTGSFQASQSATNFVISVNQSGIAAGTICNGMLLMSTSSVTQTLGVTMVVTNTVTPGNVIVSPAGPLSFAYTIGGSNPLAQSVTVSSTQTSVATAFTVAASASWILTNTGSAAVSTPYPLQIGVNPSALSASSTPYSGTVTISPLGGAAIVINVSLTVAGAPVVSATPTTLSFNYAAGTTSPTQLIQVSGAGTAATFFVTPSTARLVVSPPCTIGAPCTTPNTGTFTLTVSIDPTGLNADTAYVGSITISGTGLTTGSTMVSISLTLTAPTPAISLVTNAASFNTGPVSPGEIVSIFANTVSPIGPPAGVTLSSTTCPSPCTSVPTSMGGVQVVFEPGGVAAPLTYVSSTQINCVVPYEMVGKASGQVFVQYLGQPSNFYPLQYTSTQPGIFTALGSGSGLASVLQYDAKGNYQGQNSINNPASAGWYLIFYVTGEGIIPAPAITGQVTSSISIVPLLGPPNVLIDNLPATVSYFGEADGFVSGLMQVNAIVPAGVHTGQADSLSISIGGNLSQSGVTIYIK
jgi:uncharacterized protein (TIGR03437 family)